MGKNTKGNLSIYTIMLLTFCLCCQVTHVFADNTKHFSTRNDLWHVGDHRGIPDSPESHDHEDDIILFKLASEKPLSALTLEILTANFSAPSISLSPQTPPPKTA